MICDDCNGLALDDVVLTNEEYKLLCSLLLDKRDDLLVDIKLSDVCGCDATFFYQDIAIVHSLVHKIKKLKKDI